MDRSILLFAILCLVTASNNTKAALGWTLDETIQHYGPPTAPEVPELNGRTGYAFHIQGYVIDVAYLNGKVCRVSYDQKTVFTEPFIQAFLKVNAPNAIWSAPDGYGNRSARTADGTLICLAHVSSNGMSLSVSAADDRKDDHDSLAPASTPIATPTAKYTVSQPTPAAEPAANFGGWVLFLFLAIPYFFPTIVAKGKGGSGSYVISMFILNLLVGWTVIGWFFILICAANVKPIAAAGVPAVVK
jgi:hypothetical protein